MNLKQLLVAVVEFEVLLAIKSSPLDLGLEEVLECYAVR
jgi:hypothetical protein